jgi:biopolymer transport protein TolR
MQRKPLASINITPLVDVLLILLVIVMLAMPVFVKKLPVELPKTGVDSAPVATNSLQVALNSKGQLFIGDQPAQFADVVRRIQPNTTVELSVDEKTAYGDAAKLIARLQESNPREIVLATQ